MGTSHLHLSSSCTLSVSGTSIIDEECNQLEMLLNQLDRLELEEEKIDVEFYTIVEKKKSVHRELLGVIKKIAKVGSLLLSKAKSKSSRVAENTDVRVGTDCLRASSTNKFNGAKDRTAGGCTESRAPIEQLANLVQSVDEEQPQSVPTVSHVNCSVADTTSCQAVRNLRDDGVRVSIIPVSRDQKEEIISEGSQHAAQPIHPETIRPPATVAYDQCCFVSTEPGPAKKARRDGSDQVKSEIIELDDFEDESQSDDMMENSAAVYLTDEEPSEATMKEETEVFGHFHRQNDSQLSRLSMASTSRKTPLSAAERKRRQRERLRSDPEAWEAARARQREYGRNFLRNMTPEQKAKRRKRQAASIKQCKEKKEEISSNLENLMVSSLCPQPMQVFERSFVEFPDMDI